MNEPREFIYCSYRFSCKKTILCCDCEIYAEAPKYDSQGSWAGEEDEDCI
jgi:hypothetical protein